MSFRRSARRVLLTGGLLLLFLADLELNFIEIQTALDVGRLLA